MVEFKHTPDQARAAWVAALRSGEYKQGKGRLRSYHAPSYCCLGVACDVFLKLEERGEWLDTVFDVSGDSAGTILPRSVMRWLGLTSEGGDLVEVIAASSEDDDPAEDLIAVNDRGIGDFNFIADLIEGGKVQCNT
ncbi:hypothetical protein [Inquilinus limosus]|uniref:Uncharacterized protein n=1 Tax=Inquilinus limosus MP06 TaxID=1398085 RepID=A0A0A0DBS0_9PROT|nr:hypothetical protein [Inquilinus limosus]KGM36161.1 hypothetical protein P409_00505 [Inquilinus limosus MP06]